MDKNYSINVCSKTDVEIFRSFLCIFCTCSHCFCLSCLCSFPWSPGGYWHQWVDERFGDPPPKVDPGAFSGQRQGWKTPKRTLWQYTASVCSRSALLGDLGVTRSMERDLLSVLSNYPTSWSITLMVVVGHGMRAVIHYWQRCSYRLSP